MVQPTPRSNLPGRQEDGGGSGPVDGQRLQRRSGRVRDDDVRRHGEHTDGDEGLQAGRLREGHPLPGDSVRRNGSLRFQEGSRLLQDETDLDPSRPPDQEGQPSSHGQCCVVRHCGPRWLCPSLPPWDHRPDRRDSGHWLDVRRWGPRRLLSGRLHLAFHGQSWLPDPSLRLQGQGGHEHIG